MWQAVLLDEVMVAGLQPQQQHIVQFETRSLRDARQLLATVSLADAVQFIEQNPHPRYMPIVTQADLSRAYCCKLESISVETDVEGKLRESIS